MSEQLTESGTVILYSEGKTKRASIKPKSYLTIQTTTLSGDVFKDKFTLRGSLTSKSFKLFTEMQKHLNIREIMEEKDSGNGDEELHAEDIRKHLSEEQINALLDIFPEFFMSLLLTSDPETTLIDVKEFDTMLKLAVLGILINKMNIEQQVDEAGKK